MPGAWAVLMAALIGRPIGILASVVLKAARLLHVGRFTPKPAGRLAECN